MELALTVLRVPVRVSPWCRHVSHLDLKCKNQQGRERREGAPINCRTLRTRVVGFCSSTLKLLQNCFTVRPSGVVGSSTRLKRGGDSVWHKSKKTSTCPRQLVVVALRKHQASFATFSLSALFGPLEMNWGYWERSPSQLHLFLSMWKGGTLILPVVRTEGQAVLLDPQAHLFVPWK
jgi:hypothetical protein